MTMAPALPGVCGDAKRVADDLYNRNYSVMAEITARIGGLDLFSSVLQDASAFLRRKKACAAYEQAYVHTRGAQHYWTRA